MLTTKAANKKGGGFTGPIDRIAKKKIPQCGPRAFGIVANGILRTTRVSSMAKLNNSRLGFLYVVFALCAYRN